MKTKASVRKPFLMGLWENYPKTWKFLIDVGILLKYKTLNIKKLPDKITLPCSNSLYVNPEENRGRALLISNGITQRRLTNFWTKSVHQLKPDLVIDIGVNYGECIFSAIYPTHTTIYGIEANRHLLKYINQSKDEHPNKAQISIIHAVASDTDGEEKIFHIDQHWSGTSSAAYVPSHKMTEKVSLKTVKIDALVSNGRTFEKVLFKVDVEGYEAFVLKGMTNLFQNSGAIAGFIEFDTEYMEKLGIDVDDFLNFLKTYFFVYVFKEDDQLVNATHLSFIELLNLFGTKYIHTDLILVSDESMIQFLDLKVEQ